MAVACCFSVPGIDQMLVGVDADRLEESGAQLLRPIVALRVQERTGRQGLERIKGRGSRRREDGGGEVEVERRGHDREATQRVLLSGSEQVVAPVDRRFEGLLAATTTTPSAGEKGEP